MSAAFRRRRGSEGWRPWFSQEFAKLDRLSSDSGTWGPKRPEPTVVGIASRIPEDVKPGKLPFSAVLDYGDVRGRHSNQVAGPAPRVLHIHLPDSSPEHFFKDTHAPYHDASLGD